MVVVDISKKIHYELGMVLLRAFNMHIFIEMDNKNEKHATFAL